jgi:hypothetical protein
MAIALSGNAGLSACPVLSAGLEVALELQFLRYFCTQDVMTINKIKL